MERIKIRPLTMADVKFFAAIVSNPHVTDMLGMHAVEDVKAARQILKMELATGIGIAVVVNGEMVGCCFLYPQIGATGFPDQANREIGLMMNYDYQGRGIMGTALKMILAEVSRQHNLKTITANVKSSNIISLHLLKRNNFKINGVFNDFLGQKIIQLKTKFVNES
ncbi:GNAT family N-acetyltransferase [Lactobacillus sp. Sy-1]|uniref:GNAT family N-acetyltransferase n=1 Tax=Lactobacillus sp. Sy-1 TaxID=2109645 RepID=UPI001C59CC94|nr:GNAT family N-acetyltransferase [Lactobacillus sp. Sy-1]MBW1605307.1 GNAT family N-acetyltransferase [Lactobacillus sp. Sy-1]